MATVVQIYSGHGFYAEKIIEQRFVCIYAAAQRINMPLIATLF